jgi:hypothetical protein
MPFWTFFSKKLLFLTVYHGQRLLNNEHICAQDNYKVKRSKKSHSDLDPDKGMKFFAKFVILTFLQK